MSLLARRALSARTVRAAAARVPPSVRNYAAEPKRESESGEPSSSASSSLDSGSSSKSTPTPRERHPPSKTKGKSPSQMSGRGKERYNFNTSLVWDDAPDPEHEQYRRVTAAEVTHFREPPRRVKMLVRDFIDDSLYNPHYGYFSKNVTIFTPPGDEGYDFGKFKNQSDFQEEVAERYESEYAGPAEAPSGGAAEGSSSSASRGEGIGRQVWHTPTELFKPYFARSLMSAILRKYTRNHFPHEDLVVYEVGAGNGSFMVDALRLLRDEHPEVFARTKYRIIEISAALAKIQRERAAQHGFGDVVEVINQDFFKWNGYSSDPCFVVANEVFDNLAHDMIRYDLSTLEPRQAVVSIDQYGDYAVYYERVTDPLIRRALAYRRLLPPSAATQPPLPRALLASPALRSVYAGIPFAPNLTSSDFIPTKAVAFLEHLRDQLPAHRLLISDFSSLPDAVAGRNGPVVQTRYNNTMVPCGTFLVKQGYFDIFFPTDFELLRDTYSLIMNSPPARSESAKDGSAGPPPPTIMGRAARAALADDFFSSPAASPAAKSFRRRQIGVYTQAAFIGKYGGEKEIGPTRTRDGLSPMLGMYDNAKIMF